MNTNKKLYFIIGLLILLSPLGIILPEFFHAETAWGEWSPEEISKITGYLPEGMSKLSEIWSAPLQNYSFKGSENAGIAKLSFSYILCLIIGVILCIITMTLITKRCERKNSCEAKAEQ